MSAKILLVSCVLVAVVAAIPAQPGAGVGAWGGQGGFGAAAGWGNAEANPWFPSWGGAGSGWGNAGANPWIPPWVAAWYPQWTPCTGIGSTCVDCTTKLVCTKVGGLQRTCTDPKLPYCNLGECSATPTTECAAPVNAAAPAVPAATA